MMKTMNTKLNMNELIMITGGTGSLINVVGPVCETGPIGTCDPPCKTGPIGTCDPPCNKGSLGFPPK